MPNAIPQLRFLFLGDSRWCTTDKNGNSIPANLEFTASIDSRPENNLNSFVYGLLLKNSLLSVLQIPVPYGPRPESGSKLSSEAGPDFLSKRSRQLREFRGAGMKISRV